MEYAILDFFNKSIVSFKMPKGSIVIFDNKTIHRAKPYFDFFWRRKSLFFQIDNEVEDGEKILIKTEFIKIFSQSIYVVRNGLTFKYAT